MKIRRWRCAKKLERTFVYELMNHNYPVMCREYRVVNHDCVYACVFVMEFIHKRAASRWIRTQEQQQQRRTRNRKKKRSIQTNEYNNDTKQKHA